jgi:hypothetical protein
MDADQHKETLQSLMVRFGRAGWINRSFITPPIRIDYTPLGVKRMAELERDFHFVKASGLEPALIKESGLKQLFREIVDELSPPGLTVDEFKTLATLAEMFRVRVLDGSQED